MTWRNPFMKFCPAHNNPYFGDAFNFCPFCGKKLKVKDGEDYIADMERRLKKIGMKAGPNGEGANKTEFTKRKRKKHFEEKETEYKYLALQLPFSFLRSTPALSPAPSSRKDQSPCAQHHLFHFSHRQ